MCSMACEARERGKGERQGEKPRRRAKGKRQGKQARGRGTCNPDQGNMVYLAKLEVVLPGQILHLAGSQQLVGARQQRYLDRLLRLACLLQCLLSLLSMLLWLSLLCMLGRVLLSLLHMLSLLCMLIVLCMLR